MAELDPELQPETIAVHAARRVDPATGAVAEPIHLSTTFQRGPDGDYPTGFSYSRSDNPNRAALEHALAIIEGGAVAAAFASGLAAATAVFQTLAPNDHVIAPIEVYHGVMRLLRTLFVPWGLRVEFVDMPDLDAIKKTVNAQTKLIWVETPSNPTVKLTDLAAVAEIAQQAGALLVCDNTWSPVIQRTFALGADVVMYSTTKYFGGHSDVVGGALIARRRMNSSSACARSREPAVPCPPRSIAGWCIGGYRRCRAGCARIAKMRCASPSFWHRIRASRTFIIRDLRRIRSTLWPHDR